MSEHIEGRRERYEAEFRVHRKDGSRAWIMAKGKIAARDEEGKPLLVSGTHLDITASKEAEEKIRHLANHDELTGLPSLRLAKDRLTMAIGYARRHEDIAAIMFVDLDGFKEVNDSFGHDAGDDMLRYVARQLEGCVREVDTVARIGGDEFIIIAGGLSSRADASVIARAVVALVSQPTTLRGNDVHVSASVGIALYPADEQDPDRLIKLADEAMYEVKKNGKDGFAFAPSMGLEE
jgi:diguanylate cyclase (GGDEF)-like protein